MPIYVVQNKPYDKCGNLQIAMLCNMMLANTYLLPRSMPTIGTALGNGIVLIYLVQPASCCKLPLELFVRLLRLPLTVVGKAGIAKGHNCLIVICCYVVTQNGNCPLLLDVGCEGVGSCTFGL